MIRTVVVVGAAIFPAKVVASVPLPAHTCPPADSLAARKVKTRAVAERRHGKTY